MEEFDSNLVVLDIDGVQANLVDEIERFVWEKFHKVLNKHIFDLGLTQEEWNIIVQETKLFESCNPYPGIRQVINTIRETGKTIHSITARDISLGKTLLWLKKHDIHFHKLDRLTDDERIKYLKEQNPILYVDDKFDNVVKARNLVKYPVLINRPWNNLHNPKIIRINDLNEILNYLE